MKLFKPRSSAEDRKVQKRKAERVASLPPFDPNKYTDKLIKHESAPTKKAYIGIAKTPLVKMGHGYDGVVTQSEDRRQVQCHSCGEWMVQITPSHLKRCCGLTVREYKFKYGLNLTQTLISDAGSLARTKMVLSTGFLSSAGNVPREAALKGGIKGKEQNKKRVSMQFYNSYGTCPTQLKSRIIEFIKTNRELPNNYNRGKRLWDNLRVRYGSAGNGFKALGLPVPTRKGSITKYTFPDHTIATFNISKLPDREEFYAMMLAKCDLLKDSTP